MRAPILLLVALLALILWLSACGDDEGDAPDSGGGELAAEEFAAEADALCLSFDEENPLPPEPENAKEAAEISKSEADLRVDLMEQITALGAPEELQADLDTYNEQSQAIVDVIEGQAAAAEAGDAEAYQSGYADAALLLNERRATAEALGFESCGQNSPATPSGAAP